jgi:hypothetical protein
MTSISTEFAVESLWEALQWEPIDRVEIFDRIAVGLRRNPHFRNMSITAVDLILADARREFEHDMKELEKRLVRAFKDCVGFEETQGEAA